MKHLTMVSLAVLAVLAVTPCANATAQAPPPVEPGQRVRVTAPELGVRKQAGRLEALRRDTLVVAAEDSRMTFPVASVAALEVSRGRKAHVGTGALIGLLAGGLGGGAAGSAVDCVAWAEQEEGVCTVLFAAVGAASGVLVGAITGAVIRTERWEEVPLDRLRVSFAAQRAGRFALGVSVRF